MSRLVVDASVAAKWLTPEAGADEALKLRGRHAFIAPELLLAECANVVWKKVARGELRIDDASLIIPLLQRIDIELTAIKPLVSPATMLALHLNHPAYDCFYLALAVAEARPYVTADDRFVRKLRAANFSEAEVLPLAEAAALTA